LVDTQPMQLTEEQRMVVREIASQVAIALQQSRLRTAIQRHTRDLERRVALRTGELREVNAALEQFGSSVAHDLRAPLRTLQGFADALLEDYGDRFDETGRDYAQRIVRAASSMDALISDLLTYSRLSRSELHLQSVNLQLVVEQSVAQLEQELRERNAELEVEQDMPVVRGQTTILIQVVTNLLSNAVKFMPPERVPQVRVWAEQREDMVRLWVEDNGLGIDPRYRERVFSVFERLHGSEQYPGTGIGLAIVRKGVERMGGSAGVDSTVGVGSRFWIELPAGGAS
ncbi:MAG TPA: ATP-binding protein, partial [Roseiflexaceae bacterium]|nr:ATP-binding protein [Roseiflexaceae bacterium]